MQHARALRQNRLRRCRGMLKVDAHQLAARRIAEGGGVHRPTAGREVEVLDLVLEGGEARPLGRAALNRGDGSDEVFGLGRNAAVHHGQHIGRGG